MDERIPREWDKEALTLREVLAWVSEAVRRGRGEKREISHTLAQGFRMTLEREGAEILWKGKGNANYFIAGIEGVSIGISPFGSHEEWWEKPSDGFREEVKKRGCRWGVVLFMLPKKEGLWIEGADFDERVLRGREKVNSSEVRQARRARIANSFSDSRRFIDLIKNPPKKPGELFLIPKPR